MDKKRYLKHFSTIFLGTFIGQVINFISYPFITRLYSPYDFGIFTIILTTVSIIGTISCGRFDLVTQAAKFYERFAIYKLSQLINLVVSSSTVVIALVYLWFFQSKLSILAAPMLGILVFLIGYCNASSYFLLKHEEYKLNSLSMLSKILFTILPQILLFYLFPNAVGLILVLFLGYLIQAIMLLNIIKKIVVRRKVSTNKIKYVFYKYRRYLFIDTPSALINILSASILSYTILFLYSAKDVGFYSMGFRLIGAPLSILSSSLGQVFFQKAAKSYHEKGSFWAEFKFNISLSAVLSLLVFTGLFLLIKPFTSYYLGKEWEPAADIVIYLIPLFAVRFVVTNVSTTPLIIGKPIMLLLVNIGLVSCASLSYLLANFYSLALNQYLLLNSFLLCVIYSGFFVYMLVSVKKLVISR